MLRQKRIPLVEFDERATTAISFVPSRLLVRILHRKKNQHERMQRQATHRMLFVLSFSFCSFFVPKFVASDNRSHASFTPSHGLCGVQCYRLRKPLGVSKDEAPLNHTIRSFQHAAEIYRMDSIRPHTFPRIVVLCVCVRLCVLCTTQSRDLKLKNHHQLSDGI